MKCFLTKLGAAVDADLPEFGVFSTLVKEIGSSSRSFIVHFGSEGKVVVTGNIYFPGDVQEMTGSEITLNIPGTSSGSVNVHNIDDVTYLYGANSGFSSMFGELVDAVNLEELKTGVWPANTGATFTSNNQGEFNVESFRFTKLRRLHIAGCGNLTGDISQLIVDNPNLIELSLAGTHTNIDLSCLEGKTNLNLPCLPPASRVTGDIKYIGDTASTNLISAGRSSFPSGSLESIVERARTHGRPTGNITVQYANEWTTLTFNGIPLSDIEGLAKTAYLKWTQSEISLDNNA